MQAASSALFAEIYSEAGILGLNMPESMSAAGLKGSFLP
jgi:hypothetical protein